MAESYLSIEAHDHEHGGGSRPPTLHAHEHDDPSHPHARASGSISPSNRLTDFASHILDSRDPHSHPHVLSFTGEGGVLESSNHFDVEDVVRRAMDEHDHRHEHEHDQGDFQPHIEDGRSPVDLENGTTSGGTALPRRSTFGRGRKRKVGDVGEDGEPIDPVLMKKENHVRTPFVLTHLLYHRPIPHRCHLQSSTTLEFLTVVKLTFILEGGRAETSYKH